MVDPGGFIIISLILAVAATYIFQMWARHQRRLMIHRERLAAIEKGIELPPLEQEIQQRSWNVQRVVLLAGLVWISLGIGAFPLLRGLRGQSIVSPWDPYSPPFKIPAGLEWIGVALIGIGLSHLVTYVVGRRRERDESRSS
jgi:hypothetical protein